MSKKKETAKKTVADKKKTIAAPTAEVKAPVTTDTVVVEEKKEEVKAEVKTEEKKVEKPTKEPKQVVNPKPAEEPKIVEELKIVEEPPKKEEEHTEISIGNKLLQIDPKDRISHNSAITLASLLKSEFIDADDINEVQKEACRKQLRCTIINELLVYNAQVENDFQTLGVRVSKEHFKMLEKEASDLYGITLKSLPDPKNDKQLIIDFPKSDIPKDVKKAAKEDADARTANKSIPEPDPKMSDKEKIEALRLILSDGNKEKVGVRIMSAVDYGRKVFDMEDAVPAQILAKIFTLLGPDSDITALNGLCAAVNGRFRADHTPLSPHALLKTWLPNLQDKEISNVVKVMLARHTEKLIYHWTTSNNNAPKATEEGDLKVVSEKVLKGVSEKAVNAILKREDVVLEGLMPTALNGSKISNYLVAAYGNSPKLVEDSINTIADMYRKPIEKLSAYVDKSAYAD